MKRAKRILLSLLITALAGGAYFYLELPAINFQSEGFYFWLGLMCVVYLVASGLLGAGEDKRQRKVIFLDGTSVQVDPSGLVKGASKLPLILIGILIAVVAVGSILSWEGFHAEAYYSLLPVEEGDFSQDVAEISYSEIPMLDEASAIQLGRRALGKISSNSNLVSQFEVSDDYTQINYNREPVRVSPLVYGDLIKWFNNQSQGLPGYIVVNMVTQEARLVQLEQGMRYTLSDHFGRYLYRHLRFQYPTFLFGDVNFEIDEEGTPWWVCSREVRTIGLFGGRDVRGAVLVNAITGDSTYYEEVPSWVDRVYDADLVVEQYNYRGALVNGWINSWLGQKAVTTATEGYNFIAQDDDVYMYTGVTSAGSDESNVGFILVNQRTKEAKYYNITGAEEYSAMSSAQGAVQHLNYRATFPILLNISDQPTYFMALKDSAELVKMYAMVNVSDYQLTATGSTVEECQGAYERLLAGNGVQVTNPVEESDAEASGVIEEIRSAVIDGNTWYYLRLEGEERFFALSAGADARVVLLDVGDRVTIGYQAEDTGEILGGTLKDK